MNKLKLLYFSAPWCGPCKMFKPIIVLFGQKQPDCEVVLIDLDTNEELAKQYNIKMVPTCILLKDEVEQTRFSGVKSLAYLESIVDEAKI